MNKVYLSWAKTYEWTDELDLLIRISYGFDRNSTETGISVNKKFSQIEWDKILNL